MKHVQPDRNSNLEPDCKTSFTLNWDPVQTVTQVKSNLSFFQHSSEREGQVWFCRTDVLNIYHYNYFKKGCQRFKFRNKKKEYTKGIKYERKTVYIHYTIKYRHLSECHSTISVCINNGTFHWTTRSNWR